MPEPEQQPLLTDLNGDEAYLHVCEMEFEENEEGEMESTALVHLEMIESTGTCDHGAEHYNTVTHIYDAATARQLAAGLLNAADALDEILAESNDG